MSAPQTTLVHMPLSQLLHPLKDIRDRSSAEYRDFFDRLVADLKARGMDIPIIAYREGDKYRIIDGRTRHLAAMHAGLETVPVLVFEEKPSESDLKLGQLLANEMRQSMTPLEVAQVYVELKAMHGWNDAQLARHVHASPGQVAKLLAISTNLCQPCRQMVAKGELPVKAAYAISRLKKAEDQITLAEKVKGEVLCAEGAAVEVSRILRGDDRTKQRTVTLKIGGITMTIKNPTPDTIRAFMEKLAAALKKWKGDKPEDLGWHFKTI